MKALECGLLSPAAEGTRHRRVADPQMMPGALQVVRAMAQVIRTKPAVHGAKEIILARVQAALCLGLAEGVSEELDKDDHAAD